MVRGGSSRPSFATTEVEDRHETIAAAQQREKILQVTSTNGIAAEVVMALVLSHWMACAVALVSFDPFDVEEPEWGWSCAASLPGFGS